jgi:amidase
MADTTWEVKSAIKRADTLSKIPEQWRLSRADIERARAQRDLTGDFIGQWLDPETKKIVAMDSQSIVHDIRYKKLTAVQVCNAFCHSAAIAHQLVGYPTSLWFPQKFNNFLQSNCLHEIFFDKALERAQFLDNYQTEHGEPVGGLHGLPVSLKDQFHVKGIDTTMGYIGWIGGQLGVEPSKTHQVESQIVTDLLSAGAILYCKTAVPQTLLCGETTNNLIGGQVLNPRNHLLSCGGSSGGEGALLALGASSLGVGTDIAGSVRIPAAFNGVFALKPTPERLSYRDAANTNPGQNTYRSAVGLMSTSAEGLTMGLAAILETQPWLRDPAVVPLNWNQGVFDDFYDRAKIGASALKRQSPMKSGLAAGDRPKPLKIGVLWGDGMVRVHPPIQRGLEMVVKDLTKRGHTVFNTIFWGEV